MENKNKDHGILGFENEFRFLSNFHYAPFEYNGIQWRTSEHAYQAAKCKHDEDRLAFNHPQLSPAGSKRLGQTVTVREDWADVKDDIMYDIVKAKFTHNKEMSIKLRITEDAYIEETNYWGDIYWGVCRGEGQNKLGEILMRVRAEIQ